MKSSTVGAHLSWSTANKVGLVLLALHGLANLPRLLMHGPAPGEVRPPSSILFTEALLGALVIAAATVAWVGGGRVAARLSCAGIVLISLTALPAFFLDVSPLMRLYATGGVLLTLVSVALTLAPGRTRSTAAHSEPAVSRPVD